MDRMKERCSRQSEQHVQKPRDGREPSGCSKQFNAAVRDMENEGEREEEKCSSRRKQGRKGKKEAEGNKSNGFCTRRLPKQMIFA